MCLILHGPKYVTYNFENIDDEFLNILNFLHRFAGMRKINSNYILRAKQYKWQ